MSAQPALSSALARLESRWGSAAIKVEAVKARLKPGSRTVSAMAGGSMVALCEMRAGRLEPSRVFNL